MKITSNTPPENVHSTWQEAYPKGNSFSNPSASGAMSVSGRVGQIKLLKTCDNCCRERSELTSYVAIQVVFQVSPGGRGFGNPPGASVVSSEGTESWRLYMVYYMVYMYCKCHCVYYDWKNSGCQSLGGASSGLSIKRKNDITTKITHQVIQSDLFIPYSWRSLNHWKGHLTIPKRSQRTARHLQFWQYSFCKYGIFHCNVSSIDNQFAGAM